MTSVPSQMAGVAGAVLQVALQYGATIGLSVQAGLLTINDGAYTNFANVRASFWFQFGWIMFNLIVFLIFFRSSKVGAANDRDQQTDESHIAISV